MEPGCQLLMSREQMYLFRLNNVVVKSSEPKEDRIKESGILLQSILILSVLQHHFRLDLDLKRY